MQVDLGELYASIHAQLERYVRMRYGLGEDVVQEAFLRVVENFDRFEGDDPVPWVYSIVRNCAISELRRTGRTVPLHEDIGHDGLETQVFDGLYMQDVKRALQSLPEMQRRCLELMAEGLSQQEIAAETGTTIPAVKGNLHRGRNAMREWEHSYDGISMTVEELSSLYEKMRPVLVKYARSKLGDHGLEEDAVQDAFTELLMRPDMVARTPRDAMPSKLYHLVEKYAGRHLKAEVRQLELRQGTPESHILDQWFESRIGQLIYEQ